MQTLGDPGRKVVGRTALRVCLLGGLVLGGGAPARAQNYTGPSKCVGCHDHERQARKWQKEEPAAYKGKAHFNTLKQLDAPKAAQWAKAIGLADPYDAKGSCVKCHGTVFRGEANAGVSCESCHGPASGYNDLHQEKGSYAKAIAAGLRDLKEKPANIAKVCVECHLTTDRKLAAAGHPTGVDFDGGASLQKLVHWDTNYNFAAITSATKAAMGGRALPAGPAAAAAGPAATSAAPPAAPAGGAKAPVAAPAGVKPAEVPPATAAPAPAVQTQPAPTVAARKPTAPAAPATPPAPWDWDQPVRALPDDYVPDAVELAPGPAAPAGAIPAAPAPQGTRETTAPARRTPRPPPVVPPSLAEETPLPSALPIAPPAAAIAPAAGRAAAHPAAATAPAVERPVAPAPGVAPAKEPAAAPPAPDASRPAAADAVALRGQAVLVLEKLLRSGARTKDAPAPVKPSEYSGPDSELLRLQDEVIALALEALRRPQ